MIVRTTLDIPDEAYYIAKSIAQDQNRSLGRVVGDLILQSSKGANGEASAAITMSDYGFPTFRCAQPVTTEDVKALDDDSMDRYANVARTALEAMTTYAEDVRSARQIRGR